MNYLKVDVKELMRELRKGVVDIMFEKVDGTHRNMKCTLQPTFFTQGLSEAEAQQRAAQLQQATKEPTGVLHVWDIQENGWRSIRTNHILSVQQTNW